MTQKKDKKFAVIKTGGKQYKVSEGETLSIEKIAAEEDKAVDFDEVLLIADGDKVEIGQPDVKGAKVKAKVLSQEKADKIVVFKYKKRKNYRKKTGHRQRVTKVQIEKISAK
ncbi:50S ribosomal protein L21 [candidate division WS5 bacterium]|uniref:Large ribosomal subunit protein bL21 n=1 Tax=candidate division WS5 bacterium TaxID=2093353 RepID=A0A419DE74_9BACT|nr:MAG: 50S ribosomal protein L21 [candidate division WS5 bacterium]